MHVLSLLSSSASRDNDECLLLAALRRDKIGDMAAKGERERRTGWAGLGESERSSILELSPLI